MGDVFAEIELSNPRRRDPTPLSANARVDTDAHTLCIPEQVAGQLSLEAEATREVSVADGGSTTVPYVGPIRVAFDKEVLLRRSAGIRRRGAAGSGALSNPEMSLNEE